MDILVVEDQEDISNLIKINLKMLDYNVSCCFTAKDALLSLKENNYDLITLDIGLPDKDGLTLCAEIRSENNLTPILMLTAKGTEIDKVEGLNVGADDYLTKPFSILELQARVKALLRRSQQLSQSDKKEMVSQVIKVKGLSIDTATHQVFRQGVEIELTKKEFDLLLFFAENTDRVYSRDQLLSQIWGYHHSGYEHTVNSHINRLRNKLEPDPAKPIYIKTIWGVGYILQKEGSK